MALGDEVETEAGERFTYQVKRVVKDSGHYTFRLWSGGPHDRAAVDEVVDAVTTLGCDVEGYSVHLIAISAQPEVAQQVADCLRAFQEQGRLEYETGRTTGPPLGNEANGILGGPASDAVHSP